MSNEVITPNATMPDSNVSEVVNNLPDSDLSEAVNDIQDSFLSESVNDMQDNDLSMSVNSTQDSDSTNDAGTVENLPDTDPLDDSSTPMRDMFLSENDTFLKQFHDDFGEDLIKEVSAALSEQTSIYQDNTTWDTSNYPNRDLNNTQTYPEKDAMTSSEERRVGKEC